LGFSIERQRPRAIRLRREIENRKSKIENLSRGARPNNLAVRFEFSDGSLARTEAFNPHDRATFRAAVEAADLKVEGDRLTGRAAFALTDSPVVGTGRQDGIFDFRFWDFRLKGNGRSRRAAIRREIENRKSKIENVSRGAGRRAGFAGAADLVFGKGG
jgi:hypothetical protein